MSLACDKSASSVSASSEKRAASTSANPPAAPSHGGTAPWPENARDLNGLFATEAQNRPTGTLRAEDVIRRMNEVGIALIEQRQHLGRPYGARYCLGAKSGPNVAISLCEYVNREEAEKGVEQSRKVALSHREIRINQATSLTVRQINHDPASEQLSKRMLEEFAKL